MAVFGLNQHRRSFFPTQGKKESFHTTIYLFIFLFSAPAFWKDLSSAVIEDKTSMLFIEHNGGRLGDCLLNLFSAYSIAYKQDLELAYQPFPNAERFKFSQKFIQSSQRPTPSGYEQRHITDIEHRLEKQSNVYNLPFNVIANLSNRTLLKMREDAEFLKNARVLFSPKEPLDLIVPPSNTLSIALHIRKGGGYDHPLESIQIFKKEGLNQEKENRIKLTSDRVWPMKFPPEQYYIDQLRVLLDRFPHERLYIFLFTDDLHPDQLAIRLLEELPKNRQIVLEYRKTARQDADSVLSDFFSMMLFDCLIRPGHSNFSKLAHLLGEFKLAIYPESSHWEEDVQGHPYLIMDEIQIEENSQYVKNNKFGTQFIREQLNKPKRNSDFAKRVIYHLTNDPIDVVIPCSSKDTESLELAIEGIKKYGKDVRRVIVVSPKPLTSKAEWFDEALFPFNKKSIAEAIFLDSSKAAQYIQEPDNRLGWILQQFIKFYAPFVIPAISPNVLVLDADTIFLNEVSFIDSLCRSFYGSAREYHHPYFQHAKRLLPGFKRVFAELSGVCHHMLFQKSVLEDLFETVESIHGMPFWRACCSMIDQGEIKGSPLSEYEIYFNFLFSRSLQASVRELKWQNIADASHLKNYKDDGFHYVSWHSYLRSTPIAQLGTKDFVRAHTPKERQSSAPYLSGDGFRACADYVLDELSTTFAPAHVPPYSSIFVKTDNIGLFFEQYHPLLKGPYILITHNSDHPIPGKFEQMLESDKLIAWFGQNLESNSHPKLHPLPIGIANRCWGHGDIEMLEKIKQTSQSTPRDQLLYLNFCINNCTEERAALFQQFKDSPFCTVAAPKPFQDYLSDLARSKFVLSPRGNGLDCHRTWEALYMGAIPIVKSSSLDPLFTDLPVLIVKSWDELTQEFLEARYKEISEKNYDRKKLYLDFWEREIETYKTPTHTDQSH